MLKLKNLPSTCLFLLFSSGMFNSSAQINKSNASSKWTINPFEHKLFIENRGQFNGKDEQKNSQILYGVDNLGGQIYFTSKGLTYRYDKQDFVITEEGERDESPKKAGKDGDERKIVKNTFILNIEWLNSNPAVQLVAEQKGETYFNYSIDGNPVNQVNNVSGYSKIKYLDLYPGVDVEYVFHEQGGIKYTLIVHPGADVSKIKMKYSGNGNVSKDNLGNIHYQTPYGDIVDHAPVTFYENKKSIASAFEAKNNVVSFQLGAFDQSKTIIIDPWTQSPLLTVNNKAFDIHKDGAGNVYVYGGSAPYKLQKYPPGGGAATWVLNTPFSQWYGDMIVDGAGTSYITQGWVNQVAKVTTAGALLWNTTAGGVFEHWTVAMDCSGSKLAVAGGCCQPFISLINTANGATVSTNNINNSGADIRALLQAPSGNYYVISSTNLLIGVTAAFAPVFTVPTGYIMNYGAMTFNGGYGGRDALDASKNFLYSTDGLVVNKRNLTTGALISTVNVTGGIIEQNDGICVDSCGNVYVGSQAGVYKYDANLVFVSSVATAGVVYCVSLGSGGEILACGKGFTASLNFNACPLIPTPLTTTKSSTNASCGANNGTASVTATGGISPYTYSWSPSGQTSQTATGLSAGTYTVTVTDATGCKITAQTVAITGSSGTLTLNTSQNNVSCNGGLNGNASVTSTTGTSPYTYSWNPSGQNTQTSTGLSAGNYTVTVIDISGCSSTVSVAITQPSLLTSNSSSTLATCGSSNGSASVTGSGGTINYTYSWSNGQLTQTATGLAANTYTATITDSKGCTKTMAVIVTNAGSPSISITSSTNVNCFGGNNGTATASASGGTGALTYSWAPSGGNGTIGTGLTAGTYTVTVTDVNGCSVNTTVVITQPTQLTAAVSTSTNINCFGGNNGSATVTAAGGTTGYTYLWNNGQVNANATGLTAGSYTATVTDNKGCTQTATVTITQPTVLAVGISASTNISCNGGNNGAATITSGGGTSGYTYLWSNAQTAATATGLIAGTYTVTTTDSKGCTQTATVTITQPAAVTLVTSTVGSTCSTANGSASVTANGGTGSYTYSWSNGQLTQTATGLLANTYTVTVTDPVSGCTATSTAIVSPGPGPIAGVNSTITIMLGDSVILNATGGGTYSWFPSTGLSSSTGSTIIAKPLVTTIYCVEVTDANGCKDTACVTVTVEIICPGVSDINSVPTAFSPNGDGMNDEFCLQGWDICFSGFSVLIYDRWGEEVFKSTDPNFCWDGKYENKIMETQVFVYYIKANYISSDKEINRKGNISLLR